MSGEADRDALLLAEAQVLLAEKRTSLSTVRTGIAVVALPLTVASVLIATARLYADVAVGHLLVPVLVVCAALLLLGAYLIGLGLVRIRRYDRGIAALKGRSPELADLLD